MYRLIKLFSMLRSYKSLHSSVLRTLFVVVFFTVPIQIQAKTSLTFGVAIFPPHTVFNKATKECEGLAIDITRAIFEQKGYSVDILCTSAARIFKMIELGEVDLTINIKSTEALRNHVTFIEPAFSNLQLNLYTNSAHPYDFSLATIRGYDYEGYRSQFENDGFIFVDVPSSEDSIRLFLQNRTFALLSYKGPFDFFIQQYNLDSLDSITVKELTLIQTHYAISRKSSHYVSMKTILNRFIKEKQLNMFSQAF